MEKKEFWLQMQDQTDIYIKKWESKKPKLIVQIVHGMGEHINRYDEFASFLADHHTTVYGNDHRGHGKTGERQEHMGHIADKNGFEKVVKDLHEINQLIEEEHPGIPVILLGHSMGSFLARRFIQLYGEKIDGVILSGTGSHPGFAIKLAVFIAKLERTRLGNRTPSKLLNMLIFGQYVKSVNNPETKFDWLTRDKNKVQKYINDSLAGTTPSASFFLDLFNGLDIIHHPKELQSIPKDLPILFISGTEDPVGNKTKGVFQVMDAYYQAGINNVTAVFYEEGRHESLNEINRNTVFKDIYQWLSQFNNPRSHPLSKSTNHLVEQPNN